MILANPSSTIVYPENWLSRRFRAPAEVVGSGSTTLGSTPLWYLASSCVCPWVRSSALRPPTVALAWPGGEITVVRQRDHGLTITAHTTAPTARCPRGGRASPRIHSHSRAARAICHAGNVRCVWCARPPLSLPARQLAGSHLRRPMAAGGTTSGPTPQARDHGLAAMGACARRRGRGATGRHTLEAGESRSLAPSHPTASRADHLHTWHPGGGRWGHASWAHRRPPSRGLGTPAADRPVARPDG